MLVFWPTLMLWLGSKIQGEKRPKPLYCFLFAIVMLFSIFTPYMIYFAIFCVLFVFLQPHLRFVLKSLPILPLVLVGILTIAGLTVAVIGVVHHPETIMELLFAKDFQSGHFFLNITEGLAPVFSWYNSLESVYLSPLISLPIFALALIGLFSTTKGFFASRNSIATILLVFCLTITGFSPSAVIFCILPFSLLVAHGIKYLLEKWYGLFPENPYARISALLPLVLLFSIMIIPGLLQYIYGYRYNPKVADQFNYDLNVIRENLTDENLLVYEYYDFYKILEDSTDINVISQIENPHVVAFLGKPETVPESYKLTRIITSPMRENSDIIYLYTEVEITEGE